MSILRTGPDRRTGSSCLASQVFNTFKFILRTRLEIVCVPAHEHFASSACCARMIVASHWSGHFRAGRTYLSIAIALQSHFNYSNCIAYSK